MQAMNRKLVARRRVRGLIIFLIVVFSLVLVNDVLSIVKGWF